MFRPPVLCSEVQFRRLSAFCFRPEQTHASTVLLPGATHKHSPAAAGALARYSRSPEQMASDSTGVDEIRMRAVKHVNEEGWRKVNSKKESFFFEAREAAAQSPSTHTVPGRFSPRKKTLKNGPLSVYPAPRLRYQVTARDQVTAHSRSSGAENYRPFPQLQQVVTPSARRDGATSNWMFDHDAFVAPRLPPAYNPLSRTASASALEMDQPSPSSLAMQARRQRDSSESLSRPRTPTISASPGWRPELPLPQQRRLNALEALGATDASYDERGELLARLYYSDIEHGRWSYAQRDLRAAATMGMQRISKRAR